MLLLIGNPVTTGPSDIWIGARAEVHTDSEAVVISLPVQFADRWSQLVDDRWSVRRDYH